MKFKYFIFLLFIFPRISLVSQNLVLDSLKDFDINKVREEAQSRNLTKEESDFFIQKKRQQFIKNKLQNHLPSLNNKQSGFYYNALMPATNLDFEAGNFNGWTQFSGANQNSLLMSDSGFTNGPSVSAVINGGTDPQTGLALNSPLGGNWVARVNNMVTGMIQNKIQNKINVTHNNNLLKFAYAVVMSRVGHPCENQAYFAVNLKDTLGNLLFTYFVEAPDTLVPTTYCKGYNHSNMIGGGPLNNLFMYSNWITKCVDLSPYIGRNIIIEVIGAACTESGHWGYGYFDAKLESCPQQGTPNILTIGSQPISLNQNYIYYKNPTCNGSLSIAAPGWPSYYNWNGPAGSNMYTNNSQNIVSSFQGLHTLSIGNNSVCPITKSIYIEPSKQPTLTVTSFSSMCQNNSYTLNANGATTFTWNNGHVGPQIAVTPTAVGVFTISVAGTNSIGCVSTQTFSYNVINSPILSITGSTSLCSTYTPTLQANGAVSYYWYSYTASNTYTSNSQNITPVLNTPSISLTGTGANGCKSQMNHTMAVYHPLAGIGSAISNSNICLGNSTTFTITGLPVANYTLTSPTSSYSITGYLSNVVTPTVNTTYTISYSNFCGTVTKTISVNVYTLMPNVTFTPLSPYCANNFSVNLTGADSYSVNNTFLTTQNTATINTYATSNTITVSGTYTNSACIHTQTVVLNPLTPSLVVQPTSPICVNSPATFTVLNSGTYTTTPYAYPFAYGGPSFTVSNNFTTTPQSNLWLYYTLGYDNNGCLIDNYLLPSINIPTVTISATSGTVCAGQSSTLTATGATSYTWSNGVISNSIVVTPTATTNYSVIGVNNCSSATNSFTVVYNPTSVLTVSLAVSNQTPCASTPITFTAIGGASSFTWVPNNASTNSVAAYPATTNVYSVKYTDANGCKSISTITISPYTITISISGSDTACGTTPFIYTSSGASSYTWSVPFPLSTNTLAANNYTFNVPVNNGYLSTFTLTGKDLNNCTAKVTKSVTVLANFANLNSNTIPLCVGTTYTLNAGGPVGSAYNYTWSTGAQSSYILITPTASAVYTVQIKFNQFGCIAQGIKTINIAQAPITFTPSSYIACENDPPIHVSVNSPSNTFVFSNGQSSNAFYPFIAGTHSLYCYFIDANGCANKSAIQTITVNSKPNVSFSSVQTNFCFGSPSVALVGSPTGGTFFGSNIVGSSYVPNFSSTMSSVIYSYTSSNGCSNFDQKCFVVSNCTDQPENRITDEIGLYPNPFDSKIFIKNQNNVPLIIDVFTLDGKIIYHSSANSEIIDLSDYNPGIYFVRLNYSGHQKTIKLVKN